MPATSPRVRLCLRMCRLHASATVEAARQAGLSPGDYVGGLPVLSSSASRCGLVATLVASCALLSTLSRNIHRFTAPLRQGDLTVAKPYRATLDTLASDVHRHLELAAIALADLQPQRRAANGAARQPH